MADEKEPESAPAPPEAPKIQGGFSKKRIIWIVVIVGAVWAFAINTGSTIFMWIVGILTVLLLGLLVFAFRVMRKQKRVVELLQGSTQSTEARRAALEKLNAGKDANSPVNLFARAQLQAQDDPAAALKLLDSVELKIFPAQMQDDVSLLRVQLCLGLGKTAEARKSADLINLDNPQRAEMRPMAAAIVAEAWARQGKSKEALKLLDTIEYPKQNREQVEIQARVARIFAKFAAGQRAATRNELNALANTDPNHLGRFVMPQFRAHPELVKLARSVLQAHPSMRQQIKAQTVKR
jgi:hypothetical protein